ncbi:MAG: nucleoside deaminase [Chitinophagaceae bacterium]|nr:nucleoside deaminase [Chitinophagaceae bacterium]
MPNHAEFMQRCYELAEIARKEGESPVGSVLVKNGIIIGEGTERSRQLKDLTRHAEVVAILDALKTAGSVEGAILYTNVEPCILCSYVIRQQKIKEVVFAKYAGELGGTASPFNILTTVEIKSWSSPPAITIYR